MTPANIKAKKEHRFAVMVPVGPTEAAEVSKFLPAEPMRTKMAINCGMEAYLACREPYDSPFTSHRRTSHMPGQWRYQKWR